MSLVPEYSVGSGAATHTRATVQTVMGYAAGAVSGASQVLLTLASGEAGIQGARRVSEGVWSPLLSDGTAIPSATLLGYLSDTAGTNVCLQSNALTTTWNAVFSGGAIGLSQNLVGVDGVINTGWTLTDSDVSANSGVYQSLSLTNGVTYTQSVFIKKTTGALTNYPAITAYKSTYSVGVCVNTTAGTAVAITAYQGATIGTTGGVSVTSYNNNWWRVSFSFTANASASWLPVLHPAFNANGSGTENSAAVGTAGIYGVDFKIGGLSSYTPTTTSSVVRNSNVLSYPASGNISAAVGTVYLEATWQHAVSGIGFLWGTYVDANNYTAIGHDGTNIVFRKCVTGVNYDAAALLPYVSGTTYKIAAQWGTSGTQIYVDGVAGAPNVNTAPAQIGSTMQLGADGNGAFQPFACLKHLRIYNDNRAAAL